MKHLLHCSGVFLALLAALRAGGAPSPVVADQIEFFERKIRPVLVAECYECHTSGKRKGGLALDHRDGLLEGGETGPAIVPGDPQKSLLILAITHQHEEFKMPKKAPKLDERAIADFVAWVKMGAPDPRDRPAPAASEAGSWPALLASRRQWWSLEPVRKPALPAVKDSTWFTHPVDRFILARLEAAGLAPADSAGRSTRIRRVTYALTGLPPTPAELAAFLADKSPDAYEKVVDRLLACPRFGERWARHWMDLMRYAETHGSEGDPEIRMAWRYRDYLIRAFNDDVPCDRLVSEHIAGDLLAPRLNDGEGFNESVLGIANLRLVEHGFQPVDTLDDQVNVVDNQIDVLSKAFLGLTVSCARCHDHKFDAISQRDFYALFGVFASCRPAQVTIDTPARLTASCGQMQILKTRVKSALADAWLEAAAEIGGRLKGEPARIAETDKLAARQRDVERQIADIDWQAGRATLQANGPQPLSGPIAVWTFDGDARDMLGGLNGSLEGGAQVRNGRLILDGKGAFVRTGPIGQSVREKTFEAWVSPANLDQRGGGVITLETTRSHGFDSVVFGEKDPKQWLAGSDHFHRTRAVGGAPETARPGELVHLAIVYGADRTITIHRNGVPYGSPYVAADLKSFETGDGRVLLGLRHGGAGRGFFAGEIEEARLYDRALNAAEVAASFRAGPAQPLGSGQLTPSQRDKRAKLTAELERLRDRVAQAGAPSKAQAAWDEAQREARDNASSPLHAWARLARTSDAEFPAQWAALEKEWRSRLAGTQEFNRENFTPRWNLASGDYSKWFRYGVGLPAQAIPAGEFSIEPDGARVVTGILPAGVMTHSLSQKHGGLLTSPRFKIETDSISVRAWGGKGAMVRLIVDNYPLGVNPIFPKATIENNELRWLRLDTAYRKGSNAYIEFGTYEDLTRPVGSKKKETAGAADGRSYFGVERVVFHDSKESPREENLSALALFEGGAPASARQLAARYGEVLTAAVTAWRDGLLAEPERGFLDFFVRRGLLPVTLDDLPSARPLIAEYRAIEAQVPEARRAPGVIEAAAYDAPLFQRGDHTKPGEPVERRFLEVLGGQPWDSPLSGRLELANEIASARNPLTARVMVNRIWHHLFGRGLVPTVDNFGRLGEKPTHPELLDFLAARFVEDGWSFKKMIRLLVTSQTWQMSSEGSEKAREIDPGNALLQHTRVRRLEAEAIRDAMLAVSGALDAKMFGPGVRTAPEDALRRSIYVAVRRTAPHPFLEVFDEPKPATTRGQRDATNIPAQSLTMMNDPFVIGLAARWAKQLAAGGGLPARERIRQMFVTGLAREPSDAELQQAGLFLQELAAEHGLAASEIESSERVWQDFAQAIFSLKEFIYIQ